MSKKKKDQLLANPELESRLKEHLLSKKPILGEDSPFSELLFLLLNGQTLQWFLICRKLVCTLMAN